MNFILKLTDKEIEVIWFALVKLPYETVANILSNLQAQVNEQKIEKKEVQEIKKK